MSVVTSVRVVPALIAGEVDFRWKLLLAGSTNSEAGSDISEWASYPYVRQVASEILLLPALTLNLSITTLLSLSKPATFEA